MKGKWNRRNGSTASNWGTGPASASARERRSADLFLADLLGGAPAAPRRFALSHEDSELFLEELLRGGPSRVRYAEDAGPTPTTSPAAPPIVPVFPGFDISAWDNHIVWLWRWSNLRFIGFYLAHSASGTHTTWTDHWHDLRDMGWGVAVFWVPFSGGGIAQMASADGDAHGRRAVARARSARLERGAAIYLDVESPVLEGAAVGYTRYLNDWFQAVRTGGYTPGVYCSRLDASRLLGAAFSAQRPLLFPYSIPGRTRAAWNDTTFQLTPALPSVWDVGRDPAWARNPSAVGCQFDWFNAQRDRTAMHWPTATGAQNGSVWVDWDMAKVFDPSHARAAGAVIAIVDRGGDAARLFCVRGDRIQQMQRASGATQFSPVEELGVGPADIGAIPPAERSGFDPAFVGAASRRAGCADVFVLGLDGFVRTLWVSPRETFPRHPWVLNPSDPARRGSPIYAVSREVDQLDVFYVGADHQLVTQWWSPGALDWTRNRRVLAGPQVAGGSNLAVLGMPRVGSAPGRLDVFYVSLDHARAHAAPAAWNDAWQVVHAAWTTASDWQLAPIGGLEGAAAASGVTVARDARGAIHVVVQTRDRRGLRHATRAPGATSWTVGAGPGALPAPSADEPPAWWMTLRLNVFPDCLVLVGVTSAGELAWATWQQAAGWSAVQTAAASFSTGRRLAVARRGASMLDVVGLTQDGGLTARTIEVTGGSVRLVAAPVPEATDEAFGELVTVCGFFGPNSMVRTEQQVREAVAARAEAEWAAWHTSTGARRPESDGAMFGRLFGYYLASNGATASDTLTAMQASALGIDFGPFLAAGAASAAAATQATAIRGQVLTGAPGAAAGGLAARVDSDLQHAREAHAGAGDFSAWSAAFISACVRGAAIAQGLEAVTGTGASRQHLGADVLLRPTLSHATYTIEARQRRAAVPPRLATYHAFRPNERAPQRGDIIVQDRREHITAAQVVTLAALAGGITHGDIVVEVQPGYVVTIGGNVGDSVRKRRYPRAASGMLMVDAHQLYTQEDNAGALPALPQASTQNLAGRSTGRIFALLAPIEDCAAVPGQPFGAGVLV